MANTSTSYWHTVTPLKLRWLNFWELHHLRHSFSPNSSSSAIIQSWPFIFSIEDDGRRLFFVPAEETAHRVCRRLRCLECVCVYSSIIIIIIVMAMCVSRPQRCAAFFGWSWRPGHSFKLPSTFFFLPFLLLLYIIFPLFFFFLFVSLPCSYTRPLYLAHSLAHSIWSLKLNATTISLLRSSFMPTLTLLVFSSLSRRSLRLQPNSFHILPSLSLFLIS